MIEGIQITVVPDGYTIRNDRPVLNLAACFKPGEGSKEALLENWPQTIASLVPQLELRTMTRNGAGWTTQQGAVGELKTDWVLDKKAPARWSELFKDGFGELVAAVNFTTLVDKNTGKRPWFRVRPDGRAALTEGISAMKAAELAIGLVGRGVQDEVLNGSVSPDRLVKVTQEHGLGLIADPLSLSLGADVLARTVQESLLGATRPRPPDTVRDGDTDYWRVLGDRDSVNVRVRRFAGIGLEEENPPAWLETVIQTVRDLEIVDGKRVGWVPEDVVRTLIEREKLIFEYEQSERTFAESAWADVLAGDLEKLLSKEVQVSPNPNPGQVALDVIKTLENAATLLSGAEESSASFRSALALELLAQSRATPASREALRSAYAATGMEFHASDQYRRFMDIRGNPVLAKYFGLVIDFEWELDAELETDLIAVRLAKLGEVTLQAEEKPSAMWTVAKVDEEKADRLPSLAFRPASLGDLGLGLKSPAALQEGLVHVGVEAADSKEGTRFRLMAVDGKQGLNAFANAALAADTAVGAGELTKAINGNLPPLRTTGLEVLDTERWAEAISQQAMAVVADKLGDGFLTAEMLMVGIRFDIGIKVDENDPVEWFCPYERDIDYRFDGRKTPPYDLSTRNSGARLIERSYGYAVPSNRHKEDLSIVAQETVLSWDGGNLGLPARRKHDSNDTYEPEGSGTLPLSMHVKFSKRTPRKGSPEVGRARGYALLRDRFGYFVGGRPVYVHRGGPSLAEAYPLYDTGMRMGSTPDKALRFGAKEPVHPPEILLRSEPWEPLFQARDMALMPGSNDQTLVLRDGEANIETNNNFLESSRALRENRRVERYLVPPRVGHPIAKIGGTFDRTSGNELVPRGMFDKRGFDRVRWSGGFPEAIGSGATRKPKPTKTNAEHALNPGSLVREDPDLAARSERPSRGQVLQPGTRGVDQPYYPDPMAQVCCVLPFRRNVPLFDHLQRVLYAPSAAGEGPDRRDEILPIVIRMISATEGEPLSVDRDKTAIYGGMPGFETLIYRVPRGEEVTLCCWSVPESANSLSKHGLWPVFEQAFTMADIESSTYVDMGEGVRHEKIHDLMTHWPIPALNGYRTLRLVNALQKPLLAPSFGIGWEEATKGGSENSQSYVLKDFSAKVEEKIENGDQRDPAEIACHEWADFVEKHPNDWREAHDPGATIAWFGGEIDLHRPSTEQLEFQARWDEYDDSPTRPMRRDVDDPLRRFKPRIGRWGSVETTRRSVSESPIDQDQPVDLLTKLDGTPACSYIDFGDTRARNVSLRPVGTSRFDSFYKDPEAATNESRDAEAPTEGRNRHFFERPDATDELDVGDVRILRIPATARPPSLSKDEDPLPLYREQRTQATLTDPASGVTYVGIQLYRQALIRVFLNRPWFGSGEGQKLALLMFQNEAFQPFDGNSPKGSGNAIGLEELQGNPLHSIVTMRGRDPTYSSGSLPNFLNGADLFGHDPSMVRPRLYLPIGPEQANKNLGGPNSVEVAAAIFDVVADRTRDIWIADIGIKARETYMPFVRLGIAAYQAQCLRGLELSPPMVIDTQVPPERWISVSRSTSAPGRLRIVVDGAAFRARAPGIELTEHAHLVARPWLIVRFLERKRLTVVGKPSRRGWKMRLDIPPVERQADDPGNSISNHLWEFDVDLPELDPRLEYALAIEEFEKVPADGNPLADARMKKNGGLYVVEEFGRSTDGLSAVVRGSTRTAAIFELDDVGPDIPLPGKNGKK